MSTQVIESVLFHAMSDPAFAELLFSDTEQALASYDLEPDEAANFKNFSRADFNKLVAGSPEERRSMALSLNHNETALTVR